MNSNIEVISNGILVVDDDSALRRTLARVLGFQSWTIFQAGDMEEVNRVLATSAFFGLVLDGNFSEESFKSHEGRDGFLVAQIVREQDKTLKRHTFLVWNSTSPAPEGIDCDAGDTLESISEYFLSLCRQ